MAMLKGLKKFYYAVQTKDDETGVAYDTPFLISGVNKANIKRKTNRDIFYADDQAWEKATSRDITDIELTLADLPLEHQARLLGHTMNGAEMIPNASDVAPIVAVGIEATKSNKKSKLFWFYGCQFEDGDDDNESTGSSVKLKPQTIKASSMPHQYNGDIERVLDEDSPNYTTGQADTFFNSPLAIVDTTPPTVAVTPANDATAVVTSSAIVWTFSEAIQATLAIANNLFVVKDDGTAVAGALAINAAHTVVTFTPAADLSAATTYHAIATASIKDNAGNALAAPSYTKFTTA